MLPVMGILGEVVYLDFLAEGVGKGEPDLNALELNPIIWLKSVMGERDS